MESAFASSMGWQCMKGASVGAAIQCQPSSYSEARCARWTSWFPLLTAANSASPRVAMPLLPCSRDWPLDLRQGLNYSDCFLRTNPADSQVPLHSSSLQLCWCHRSGPSVRTTACCAIRSSASTCLALPQTAAVSNRRPVLVALLLPLIPCLSKRITIVIYV